MKPPNDWKWVTLLLVINLIAAFTVLGIFKRIAGINFFEDHLGWPVGNILETALFLILLLPGYAILSRSINRDRQYTRWKSGQCTHCSYDLRAHAPGATCPECGTPIPAQPATMKQSGRSAS